MEKKCYNCVHRRAVPGSAHSACNLVRTVYGGELAAKMEMGLSLGLLKLTNGEGKPVLQLAGPGVRAGWAKWPLDFDPVWVKSCEGFWEIE